MAALVVPQSRSHRRFYSELCRIFGMLGVECSEARASLTLTALRLIFRRLCTHAGATHPIEAHCRTESAALQPGWTEAVTTLLDQWEWGQGGEGWLGADVLGYVFEQSLARKELGAYFTAPDVAAYICRSTLLPRLIESVGELPDLRRLAGSESVSRYLPTSVRQAEALPLESRFEWHRRQLRQERTAAAFAAGRIATAGDCLTWNLDLLRIALDCIERSPDAAYVRRWEEALSTIRVLDPTCGSGDFLLAAYDLLALLGQACRSVGHAIPGTAPFDPLARLYGVDVLPGAVEVTRMRLYLRAAEYGGLVTTPNLISADFLAAGPGEPGPFRSAEGEEVRFDAAIGNPPYVGCVAEREQYRQRGYETTAGGNLYALVMERSLSLLAARGRLGMIVPISSVSVSEFGPLVRLLADGSSWVSTYSNRPAKLFEGVEQRLAIWLTAPDGPPRLHVSSYQHWWREERPYLFDRLHYCESALHGHHPMPAKTGCPVAERILQRIAAHQGCLGELVSPGEHGVWLHDGPTYWVRALPFRPNEAQVSKRSSHYHRLPAADAAATMLLSAVLSSGTFYLYYKWTSNCRDLGQKDWSHFPLDRLPTELRAELAECGSRLAETLRVTAARRTRVYPSGQVTYEEYYPAHAKEILDEIDRVLARHYGFDDEELEYILNYDLKYRMGRHDTEHDEH